MNPRSSKKNFMSSYGISLLLILGIVLFAPQTWACRVDPPQVQETDIQHPPEGMLSLKGQIIKINTRGALHIKPHNGFSVELKIIAIYQGDLTSNTVTIKFGPCHNLPGKVGDIIPVLALKNEEGWYAPQFWSRPK